MSAVALAASVFPEWRDQPLEEVLYRCRELLDHDAGHLVRSRLTPGLRAALAGAICLPILLGLGLFLLFGALVIEWRHGDDA